MKSKNKTKTTAATNLWEYKKQKDSSLKEVLFVFFKNIYKKSKIKNYFENKTQKNTTLLKEILIKKTKET